MFSSAHLDPVPPRCLFSAGWFRLLVWLGLVALLPLALRAQTSLWWDGDGSGTVGGGSGTWNTSSTRWSTTAGGNTYQAWSNTNPTDYANFTGTGGTVSWAANISVRRITFGVNGYTLARSSSTLTLVTDGWIDTGAFNATISGPMAGTVGMTKLGTGNLTLSGANTYTGTTNIGTSSGTSGGTLTYGAINAINTGAVTVYAGTLDIQSYTDTIGALTLGGGASGTTANVTGTTGVLTLGGNVIYSSANNANGATISAKLGLGTSNRTFTINDSSAATADLTISGVISDARSITKAGNGTLVLSGANTYSGGTTTLSAGTLTANNSAALSTSTLALNAGTLNSTNGTTLSNAIRAGGNATISNITITGALTQTGNRTLTLDNATLGGSVFLSDTSGTGRTLTASVASGTSTISGAISNFNGSGTAGNLIKTGAGTLTLSGTNTYTGTTTISGGTLQVGAGGTSGSIAGTSIVNNATLVFNRSDALTYSGTISGTGAVTKEGAGALTLAGNNSYSGLTTINNGTLKLGTAGSGGNGPLGTTAAGTVVNTNGALDLNGNTLANAEALTINGTGVSTAGALTNSGAAASYSGVVTLGSPASIGGTGNITLTAGLAGNNLLTKSGSNTLTLNASAGARTGGAQIDAGTLKLGNASALGSAAQTITLNSGTLDLATDTTVNAYNTTVSSGSTILSNRATAGSGTTHTLGTLSINGSTLNVAAGSTVSANGAYGLTFGATTLTGNAGFNVANNGSGTGTLTLGALNDGGIARTLTKSGTGTLTLNAAAGTWTTGSSVVVNNGTLQVGATNALGASALTDITVNATTAGTTATFATGSSANQSVKSLTFGGAGATSTSTNNVSIGSSSTLTLGGNVTYDATNNPLGATISGNGTLAMGSATRSFAVGNSSNAASDLTVSSVLSGTGGLIKTGTGTMVLSSGSNTFNGSSNGGLGVVVAQGTLQGTGTTNVGGFAALGNYSGLVSSTDVISVTSGATLAVQSSSVTGIGNGSTASFKNLVLNGSGADGGGALRSLGGNSTWTGNTILGSDATITNAAAAGDANLLFLGAYYYNTDSFLKLNNHTLTFNGTGDTYVTSKIGNSSGDTGSVIINGGTDASTVYFGGYTNYYTGDTTVNRGRLELQIDRLNPPNSAILGNLTIGSGSLVNSAEVTNYFEDQIADTSLVTINRDGTLDLATHGVVDTIGNLVLNGGQVLTSADGELKIAAGGSVDVNTALTSTIDGRFRFEAANGTFDVEAGSTLMLSANVFGTNFTKAGDGQMIMTFDNLSNGYTGTTFVNDGILTVRNSGALGGVSSGTVVSSGATLQLENTSGDVHIGPEALSIAGTGFNNQGALESKSGANNIYGGAITLTDDASIKTTAGYLRINGSVTGEAGSTSTVTIGGAGDTRIHGPINNGAGGTLNLTKVDSGTLYLSGSNQFTGAINVQAGTVDVMATHSLDSGVNAVAISSGATFAVSGGGGNTNTIGSVTGTGTISIAASTNLEVNNTASNTFDGTITGTGLFDKTGSATFTFSSTANTSAFNFDGTVQVSAGELAFQGGAANNALTIGQLTLLGGTTLTLNSAYINVGTLYITGNTILDFGTVGSSVLNATNIYIAAGAILTIKNWSSEVDFLFATNSGYAVSGGFRLNGATGTLAVFNQIGAAPENQVHFEGDVNSPDGSHTTWINNGYDGFTNWQIRPIPEPSTYGALLVGGCVGLLAYRRFRRNRK